MTKEERLMELMGKISDEYIDEAHASINFNNKPVQKPKYIIWKSIAAVATCICILTVCLPILQNNSLSSPEENTTPMTEAITTTNPYLDSATPLNYIPTLIYDNCSYEIFESPISTTILEMISYNSSESFFFSKGVSTAITDEVIGKHICYLSVDNRQFYIKSSSETKIELLEYAPSPCSGIYIVNYDNTYMYAFITNINISPTEQNASPHITDLFKAYGIYEANHIEAVYVTDNYCLETIGEPITNSDNLQQLYTHLSPLVSSSPKDCSADIYKDLTAEEIELLIKNIDKRYTNICIKSTSGLKFTIKYLHDYGWLYSSTIKGYYKVSDELKEYFDQYLTK